MPKPPIELCIKCKGARNLCGLGYCPLLVGLRARAIGLSMIEDKLVDGSSPPTLIVGEKGYPKIRVYYGVPPGISGEEAKELDNPDKWFLKRSLGDIIGLRSRLLHIILPARIYNPYTLYEKEIGLAAVSERPVDTEAEIRKKPALRIAFDPLLPPRGPSALAEKLRVVSNPKPPKPLEKIIWDDLRAAEAVVNLYNRGVDFYTIVRALTIGFLGRKGQRKLVPTRWGITVVDQAISSELLKKIRTYKPINETLVFYSEYLYNKYMIILSPGPYNGLWIEVWQPRSLWNPSSKPSVLIVRENYRGKMDLMDGGYLAARTSVLEYLHGIRRQARFIILREVLPQYIFPVGNWQIRLTVKHALKKQPVARNPSRNELLEIINKYFINIPPQIKSNIIRYLETRNKILDAWL